ncbi:NAD(P)H-dependent 6'-deoxychalcone synthase [Glycine soja]|uniref:NAD(P)H-dependent 6'-deoxychalcone synthase n=1 Tax=Glycine soja TaxID=3848 RepID=A0A0B2PEE2_GLYSO|nr:NAD(P)H-dependent 6'-deoxychalcone synthase [Glycine soja]
MPVIALGTAADTNKSSEETTEVAVIEAIKLGYRHFDTASDLQLGLVKSIEELFITSKLWPTNNFPHLVLPALQKSLQGVWKGMEECQKLGLAKSIGVSNFTCKKLEDLLSFATIPPSVNQVEMNPAWHQKKLKEIYDAKGIIITAFSPLGAKGASWGSNVVMGSEILKEIAEAHGRTIAQVLKFSYSIN